MHIPNTTSSLSYFKERILGMYHMQFSASSNINLSELFGLSYYLFFLRTRLLLNLLFLLHSALVRVERRHTTTIILKVRKQARDSAFPRSSPFMPRLRVLRPHSK